MAGTGAERYRQTIRELSDRIVEAQRPIRILDAIKWDASVQQAFFADECRELPRVDRAYYESRPLPFDPEKKRQEFQEIDREIYSKLGQFSPVGAIMRRMCREYRTVVRMLESRGTPDFSRRAQELYGAARDAFHAGDRLEVLARNDLAEPVFATPAIADGTLYVRTNRHLWAFRNEAQ